MITYDDLQHYNDKQSWELELVADVTAGWKQQNVNLKCFDNLSKKVILKDETIAECLVVSSHVPTLKQQVE